jgi:hypothetical protein
MKKKLNTPKAQAKLTITGMIIAAITNPYAILILLTLIAPVLTIVRIRMVG